MGGKNNNNKRWVDIEEHKVLTNHKHHHHITIAKVKSDGANDEAEIEGLSDWTGMYVPTNLRIYADVSASPW